LLINAQADEAERTKAMAAVEAATAVRRENASQLLPAAIVGSVARLSG